VRITHEATQTIRRTTQAPLWFVWVKGTQQRVLSLGLEKVLGARARVHKGLEGSLAQAPQRSSTARTG
jgi:hypothetical protein